MNSIYGSSNAETVFCDYSFLTDFTRMGEIQWHTYQHSSSSKFGVIYDSFATPFLRKLHDSVACVYVWITFLSALNTWPLAVTVQLSLYDEWWCCIGRGGRGSWTASEAVTWCRHAHLVCPSLEYRSQRNSACILLIRRNR